MKGYYIFKGKCIGENKIDLEFTEFKADETHYYFDCGDYIKVIRKEFVSVIFIEG